MISLDGATEVLINFGERPFAYAPNGGEDSHKQSARSEPSTILPVCAWARMRREELRMLEAGPAFATLQCLDGPNRMLIDADGTMFANDKKVRRAPHPTSSHLTPLTRLTLHLASHHAHTSHP